MARCTRLTASFTAIVGALISAGACSGSSEVNFDDVDATSGGSSNAGSAGRGGSGGNDASAGSGGAGGSTGGSTGGAGAGGTAATAGVGGAAGRGGSSGSAGRGGTNGSAGSAGVSGSAGRGGTAGSAGTSGTGGRGGTAGTAGTAGASGTAGTGGVSDGGVCPTAIPAPGSNCAPDGLSCSYGDCCPVYASCAQGHWQLGGPPCVPPVCPASQPRNGDECNPCQDASQCRYERCDQDGVVAIANCNAQTRRWQVLSASCDGTPCGNQGMTCDADEVCVRNSGGTGPNFSCQDDPCAPNALSCQCAANLCQSPFTCSSATNRVVTCSCLTCQ